MRSFQIQKGIYWVGALDPDLRTFDIIMKSERGTTYNSYLVKGLSNVALIETVRNKFQEEHFDNIAEHMDFKELNYIILNHTEPDHSGSLDALMEKAPQAKVVISKNAAHFLKNLMNRDIFPIKVGDGDYIDLGNRRIEFINTPFLHWPDTMLTYMPQDGVLFPCDLFGCHFCDEKMFDDLVDDFSYSFKYYFDHIMRPFKENALRAINRISALDIDIIAPSHGPILRANIERYLSLYKKWSEYPEREEGRFLVFYASAYGNTERLARSIAGGIRKGGGSVSLFDMVSTDYRQILPMIEAADGVLVGSPTINGDAVKAAWDLLSSMTTIKVKGKIGASFGSYGWSGEAIEMINRRLKDLKFRVPLAPFKVAFTPTDSDLEESQRFGESLVKIINDKSNK